MPETQDVKPGNDYFKDGDRRGFVRVEAVFGDQILGRFWQIPFFRGRDIPQAVCVDLTEKIWLRSLHKWEPRQ